MEVEKKDEEEGECRRKGVWGEGESERVSEPEKRLESGRQRRRKEKVVDRGGCRLCRAPQQCEFPFRVRLLLPATTRLLLSVGKGAFCDGCRLSRGRKRCAGGGGQL